MASVLTLGPEESISGFAYKEGVQGGHRSVQGKVNLQRGSKSSNLM